MPRFTHSRRVQFVDTDMAGIVHFSNFYRFMEEAEHAFFRSLGFKLLQDQSEGDALGWPRVETSCQYEAPAYYDDLLEIDLDVVRIGARSLTMSFTFRRGEARIAAGEVTTVCCTHDAAGKLRSIDIPQKYREAIGGVSGG
jgi:YbgC/YbaW family acyl-CoA thioester hydrolase